MKQTSAGSTIVEILIVIGVVTILFTGLLSVMTRSQKTSSFSRNQNEAARLSNLAADWLRNQRSTLGWNAFIATIPSGNNVYKCLNTFPPDNRIVGISESSCGTNRITGTTPDNFYWREIEIDSADASSGYIEFTVRTKWFEDKEMAATASARITRW